MNNQACETLRFPINADGHQADFIVTLVADRVIGLECCWDGDGPPRLSGQRRRRFWRAYEVERHRVMQAIAQRLGGTVAVIDL